MTTQRLSLESGHWYGWQMLPGYSDTEVDPYFSPIRVTRVTPKKTGARILTLSFWNAFYAEGVQDFALDLKILRHQSNYLIAKIQYGEGGPSDRSAVISRMSLDWLRRFCPEVISSVPPEHGRSEVRLDVPTYLDQVFGFGGGPR